MTRRHTLLTRAGGMWRVPCDTREVRVLGCDSYTWVTRRHMSVTRLGVGSGTEFSALLSYTTCGLYTL